MSTGLGALEAWFRGKGWAIYAHQRALLKASSEGRSSLLIAPTGGGKTLAGFLPSLVALSNGGFDGLHTIYISPLKALAVDVQRNLLAPIEELSLAISVETRTGDTSYFRKMRHFKKPPHILLTTPESLELLLSYPASEGLLSKVQRVIIDEVQCIGSRKTRPSCVLMCGRASHLQPKINGERSFSDRISARALS